MNTLRDRAVQAHTEHRERLEALRRENERRARERAYRLLQEIAGESVEVDDDGDCIVACGVPLYASDLKLWARRPSRFSPQHIRSLADLGEVILEWEARGRTVEP